MKTGAVSSPTLWSLYIITCLRCFHDNDPWHVIWNKEIFSSFHDITLSCVNASSSSLNVVCTGDS